MCADDDAAAFRSIIVVDLRSNRVTTTTHSVSDPTRTLPVADPVALSTLSERRRLRMSVRRASSVERNEGGSYLSRWSRANTPVDSTGQFSQTVQRSFTPVREISRRQSVQLEVSLGRRPVSAHSCLFRITVGSTRGAQVRCER